MKQGYEPQKIEAKWQKVWDRKGHPKPKGKKGKYYILDMFPYPSGDGLHVGHVENFTATDIYARFKRFQGYEVLHPMGWDAFGLPAENFAIKTQIHPSKKTKESIKNFTRQIKSVGLSYDWDREINTSSPEYYKWTQWMFLFLYKNGLAYKKKAKVNWCPSCQTVLANEQVVDGKCERSGDVVIQKDLEQWFFKITDFIEDTKTKTGKKVSGLISGLNKIDWPESTKAAQKNWIGRSEGTEVVFYVTDSEEEVKVFTTRLDTIFGCSYVVIAPEHPLITTLASEIKNLDEVKKYLAVAKKKTDLERTELNKNKTGVILKGVEVAHPFTGKRLSVYVADYVLGTYGTGAVMGVPAHDERDGAFAKKYGLDVMTVIEPVTGEPKKNEQYRRSIVALVENKATGKFLSINWGEKLGGNLFIGGGLEEGEDVVKTALREIKEETGYKNVVLVDQSETVHHHYFAASKNVARTIDATGLYFQLLDETQVKQKLEKDEQGKFQVEWLSKKEVEERVVDPLHRYLFEKFINEKIYTTDGILTDSGEFSGLTSFEAREKMAAWLRKEGLGKKVVNYRLRDWLVSRQRYWGAPIPIIYCEHCGAVPVPEKDLPVKLPTDVDFRPTGESPLVRSKSFHKVKCPKCKKPARREVDTMDTFVCSSWYFLRFADPKNVKAFASKKALEKYLPVDFYMGGAEHTVLHLLYARFFTKALMKHGYLGFDEPFMKLRHQGTILAHDGQKMSKSKGNVVNPDQVVAEFGADSLRLYEMFMGPLEDMKAWKTESIIGLTRFLEKVWKLKAKLGKQADKNLESSLHKTIKKVTEDTEELKFNTAISSLMILVNEMDKTEKVSVSQYKTLLILLSPFAPHITEELWSQLSEKKSIFLAPWPKYDAKKIVAETMTIAVQVNGKVRLVLSVEADTNEATVKELALADAKAQTHIAGKTVRKVIYIPGKIVSIVTG